MALAAQDSLKNLFVTMMIIVDRPFRVGDHIMVQTYDGFVEEIGLRSTRLRLLNGHLVSLPNDQMARIDVENIGRRPHIRRDANLLIPLDTPRSLLEKALELLRELLTDHEGMDPEFQPRIFFNEFNLGSFNIHVTYWFTPPKHAKFLAFSEKVNLGICRVFEEHGIQFSLPTRVTHVDLENREAFELKVSEKHSTSQSKPAE